MIKFIKRTLLFILIVALIAGGFIVYQGHQVYKNALNSISLADKIEKIKTVAKFKLWKSGIVRKIGQIIYM